jgi:hypothetical protein
MTRGLVIDEKHDLFKPYHSLMVKAMTSVSQACSHMMWPEGNYCNLYLRQWLKCNFTGKETFEEVKMKLFPKVRLIADYFDFIWKVTPIKFFISIHENNSKYVTLSFNMTFETFDKFNQSTCLDVEREQFFCDVEKTIGEERHPDLQLQNSHS